VHCLGIQKLRCGRWARVRRRAVGFLLGEGRQNAVGGQSTVGKYSAKLLMLIGCKCDFLPCDFRVFPFCISSLR
jgi:hypothetical protein